LHRKRHRFAKSTIRKSPLRRAHLLIGVWINNLNFIHGGRDGNGMPLE
jgi:hypothetical protein